MKHVRNACLYIIIKRWNKAYKSNKKRKFNSSKRGTHVRHKKMSVNQNMSGNVTRQDRKVQFTIEKTVERQKTKKKRETWQDSLNMVDPLLQ